MATGRGDDGTTGLLFGGDRVRKDDLRTEAYGTVDEAVAALGVARAELGVQAQYGALSPNFGGLGRRDPAAPARAVRRRRGARDQPRGTATASRTARRACPRRWSTALDALLRETEAAIELPREFVVPGRDARQRRPRGRPHASPPRRAPDRHPRRRRRGHRRRPRPALPEPSRRPALDPRPRGRAGRGEAVDRGPAFAGLAADRTRRHPRGANRDRSTPVPHRPVACPRRQLGVRPAPALVQQLLLGAFGWMFAGLLLTAGVAYLVGGNQQLIDTVGQYWFLIAIGQFALAIGIQGAINRISPDREPRAVLRLRRVDGLHHRADRQLLHDRVRRVGVLLRGGDVRGGGGLRRRHQARAREARRHPVHGPDRHPRRVGREHLPRPRARSAG